MAWVRIDEEFYDHPRWAEAPGDSIALWLAAMAWCNRNDSIHGFIPVAKTNGLVNVRNVKRTCADLVERGAFETTAGGYIIHDYEDYQQPEKVKEIREKKVAAGKAGARARWHPKGMADAIADAMPDAIANEWPVPDPDPDPVPAFASTTQTTPPLNPGVSGGVDNSRHRIIAERYGLMAVAQCSPPPDKPDRYALKARTRILTDPSGDLQRYALEYPDAAPDAIAAWLHGDTHSMQYQRRREPEPEGDIGTVTRIPMNRSTA